MKKAGVALTRRARRARVLASAALLATAFGSSPSAAAQAENQPVDAVTADITDVLAAAQLAKDYDVPLAEATMRIERQGELSELAADIAAEHPDTTGGSYIDHERGGKLIVLDTEAVGIADEVPDAFSDLVVVEEVQYSEKELIDAAVRIGDVRGVEDAEDPIWFDFASNQIEVPVSPSAPEDADVIRELQAVNDEDASIARPVAEQDITQWSGECRLNYMLCDAPLRGGIGMAATNNWGACTAGFNVASKSDGALYILTAGHCTSSGNTFVTEFSNGSRHTIGSTWPGRTYYPGNDAGLIRVSNVAGWNPQWWVNVQPSYGTPATTENERYPIYGTSMNPVGTYVCKTGAVSDTTCGEIFDVGYTAHYAGVGPVYNLARARMRGCAGDSGAPVYKSNKAYGIVSGGPTESHLVSWNSGIDDNNGNNLVYANVPCSSVTYYTGIGSALGLTNTKLIGT